MSLATRLDHHEGEASDLRREVAGLNRLDDNFDEGLANDASHLEKEASVFEATIFELREDLDAACRKHASLNSRLEKALHDSHEHQQARQRIEASLAVIEKDKSELLANAQKEAQQRICEAMEEAAKKYEAGLAVVFAQVDEEKQKAKKVENLLQEYINRTKGEMDEDSQAEDALTGVQPSNDFTTDASMLQSMLHESQAEVASLKLSQEITNAELAELRLARTKDAQALENVTSSYNTLRSGYHDQRTYLDKQRKNIDAYRTYVDGKKKELATVLEELKRMKELYAFVVQRAQEKRIEAETEIIHPNPVPSGVGTKRGAASQPELAQVSAPKRPRIMSDNERRIALWQEILIMKANIFTPTGIHLRSPDEILVKNMVPPEKLPSLTCPWTGYIASSVLSRFYDLDASQWPTCLMICPESCQGNQPRRIPGQPSNSEPSPRAMFGTFGYQPGLPMFPGEPGYLIMTHNLADLTPEILAQSPAQPLSVSPGSETDGEMKWLYLGEYTYGNHFAGENRELWKRLPQQVRDNWVKSLSSAAAGSDEFGTPPPWHCWRLLARLALRKRGLPLGHIVPLARGLATCNSRNFPDLDITAEDVKNVLDSKSEGLYSVKLIPKSFNAEWYLEQQSLASGELTETPLYRARGTERGEIGNVGGTRHAARTYNSTDEEKVARLPFDWVHRRAVKSYSN